MVEDLSALDQNIEELDQTPQKDPLSTDLSFMNTIQAPLAAKPEAIDIYKNAVGNPITGSNPAGKASTIDNSVAVFNVLKASQKQSEFEDNPYLRMRPYTYNGDYDGANFERYYSTKTYNTLGFSP